MSECRILLTLVCVLLLKNAAESFKPSFEYEFSPETMVYAFKTNVWSLANISQVFFIPANSDFYTSSNQKNALIYALYVTGKNK